MQQQISQIEINNDGEGFGPTPLQNDVVPDETYKEILNVSNSNNAQESIADIAVTQINMTVQQLRNSIVNELDYSTRNNGNTANYPHGDIYKTNNEFVNIINE